MSGSSSSLAAVLPGDVVAQGKAIIARLKLTFPANKFQHKVLPPRIDKIAWKELTTGAQPFIGRGFQRISRLKEEMGTFRGTANWIVLVAVRMPGKPEERYFGDAVGVGVLTLAPIAAAILHGWVAAPWGTALVTDIANVAADEWSDDSSIISVSVQIPIALTLNALLQNPGGASLFEEMAETWVLGGDGGITTTYNSDWENPNV